MALLWDLSGQGVYNTSSFTSGIRSAMNTAKWSTVITPPSAFTAYGSGFHSLIANGNGGLWVNSAQIELYRDEDGSLMAGSGTITNAASNPITITVDPPNRQITIAGAGAGNGTFTWANVASTIFATGSVGVSIYSDGTSYGNNIAVGDVQDFVTSLTGDSAITLGAAAVAATGSIEMVGDGAITLGALTVIGADTPQGNATITLDALTVGGTGTVEMVGVGAITLGGIVVSATATGPAVWAVGVSTFAQRNNNFGPSTGTLTTTGISTTTGSILIASIARGKWDTAGVPSPKGPTDSQGNTWTSISPGPTAYSGYPDSQVGLWWCVNNAGHASHTFSAAWGPYGTGAGGNPGDEVTISVVELLSNGELTMIDSASHVERATPIATCTGSAVTPTGPSITVAFVEGNGPVGQTHVFTRTAGAISDGWVAVPGATFTADTSTDGYIQVSPYVLIDQGGTKTGAAQNIAVTGTSSEGGQVFQFVFQTAAGKLGDGGITLGAATVAGDAVFPMIGDSAITLGAAGVSSTSSIELLGDASITLGAATLAGTSSIDVSGDGVVVLGSIGLVADGSILLEGLGAITLGSITASGTSDAPLVGDGAITLGTLIVVGGSQTELTGDGAVSLGALVVAGTGAVLTPLVGDGAIVLGSISMFATGGPPSAAIPSSTQRLSIAATWGLMRATIAADVAPTRPIITKD